MRMLDFEEARQEIVDRSIYVEAGEQMARYHNPAWSSEYSENLGSHAFLKRKHGKERGWLKRKKLSGWSGKGRRRKAWRSRKVDMQAVVSLLL
jgi:hypothetical protein